MHTVRRKKGVGVETSRDDSWLECELEDERSIDYEGSNNRLRKAQFLAACLFTKQSQWSAIHWGMAVVAQLEVAGEYLSPTSLEASTTISVL